MTHEQALSAALETFRLILDERGYPMPEPVEEAFREGLEQYRRLVDDGD